jgi:hypothetical protein
LGGTFASIQAFLRPCDAGKARREYPDRQADARPSLFHLHQFSHSRTVTACNDNYLDSALFWNCDLHREIVALHFAGLLTPGNFD